MKAIRAYKKEDISMIMNYYHPFQGIPEVNYHQQGQQFSPEVDYHQQGQQFFPEVDYRQQGQQFFPGGSTSQRLDRLERQVDRLSRHLDRLDHRVDRIERRLGIGQGPGREDF